MVIVSLYLLLTTLVAAFEVAEKACFSAASAASKTLSATHVIEMRCTKLIISFEKIMGPKFLKNNGTY